MAKKERKVLFWRILLGILLVCNMIMVFLFSSQNALKSALLSQKVTINFVEMIPKDFFDRFTQAPEEIITPPPELPQPPQSTTPPEGKPEETTPGETKPEETRPGETTPEETTPEETAPEETTPEETTPEETTPEETTPEETTPEETTPEETTPEETTTEEPEDPMDKLTDEQKALVSKMHTPIRKLAHMIEFGSLAALAFLFLLTWTGNVLWRYGASLGFAFVYAALDEWHQLFEEGRGPQFSDVLIDFTGAFIAATCVLIVVVIIRQKRRLVTTHYDLSILPEGKEFKIGLVADLHSCRHQALVERLRAENVDVILLAGDIMECRDLSRETASAYAFLRECANIAPTYYSLGNHEISCWYKKDAVALSDEVRERIAKTGVTLLHNESAVWNDIRICGLTSGLSKKENRPDEAVLAEFAKAEEFRILLCHHPEYYEPYISKTNVELTVSGHAHGGQWRFFGHGIYAPGQGILPKYTAGVVEDRFVISRGVGDHVCIPRFANPRELVVIRCKEKNETK